MSHAITFSPLIDTDISRVTQWFNQPHVVKFYSLRNNWTEAEVSKKLIGRDKEDKPVYSFIICKANLPIGYVQFYKLSDFPWPDQDLSMEVVENGAGLDLFIGEPDLLGQGLGAILLSQCLEQLIWPKFEYCVVDPDVRNLAMIRCNEKVGFKEHKIISTDDALHRPVMLKLMLFKRW